MIHCLTMSSQVIRTNVLPTNKLLVGIKEDDQNSNH